MVDSHSTIIGVPVYIVQGLIDMSTDEWENLRFWLVLVGGVCTVSALVISAYLTTLKPGLQAKI